jgi:uncharacterized cupredoxin-like copper-binding protein
MTTTDARAPAAPPPGGPAPNARPSLRSATRAMRGTLIFVGLLLVAIGVTIVIGLAWDSSSSSGPSSDVHATTVDFRIAMPKTLSTGKHTIVLTNHGREGHEIVMWKTALPADQLPLNQDGDVNEESPSLTTVADSGDALAPGGSKAVPTAALTPGHYVVACNLPGHYGLGMRLDVTVR